MCDSLLHEEGIPLNDGNGNKKLTANTVFEYLAKLDSYLLQPAIIYNAPGLAKRLLKSELHQFVYQFQTVISISTL